MHWIILDANTHPHATLPFAATLWVVGPFLAATAVWAIVFVGRFYRKSA
jgi:hypothetical protein